MRPNTVCGPLFLADITTCPARLGDPMCGGQRAFGLGFSPCCDAAAAEFEEAVEHPGRRSAGVIRSRDHQPARPTRAAAHPERFETPSWPPGRAGRHGRGALLWTRPSHRKMHACGIGSRLAPEGPIFGMDDWPGMPWPVALGPSRCACRGLPRRPGRPARLAGARSPLRRFRRNHPTCRTCDRGPARFGGFRR